MPKTRRTDPSTSFMAAATITVEAISQTQIAILKILFGQSLSDEQIREQYENGVRSGNWKPASESGLRSRRSELVDLGLVEQVGLGKTKFGRATILWGLAND